MEEIVMNLIRQMEAERGNRPPHLVPVTELYKRIRVMAHDSLDSLYRAKRLTVHKTINDWAVQSAKEENH